MNFSSFPPYSPPAISQETDRDIADTLEYLDDSFETTRRCSPKQSVITSENTPLRPSSSSATGIVGDNSSGKAKRVEFSPWTNFHKPPDFTHRTAQGTLEIRPLPPSRTCKSMKSILKPVERRVPLDTADHNPIRLGTGSAHKFESFSEMLESALNQLASDAQDLRLDAYIALIGTLKAFDEVPEVKELQARVTLFLQFIRRDMTPLEPSSPAGSNLRSQALKLLTVLLRIPGLAASFDDDFCTFLVDRSISAIQHRTKPKAVFMIHLCLLATRDFGARVMTPDRASSLITALKDIRSQTKSNNIIGCRLLIYRQLLKSNRQTMVTRAADWMEHIFHGMVSSFKEIRGQAIELGLVAGISLGTVSQCSRFVIELLNRDMDGGITYGSFLCRRLLDLLAKDDDPQSVPQIWIVPVLFFRHRQERLEKWSHLKRWLSVIQKCLNAADPGTRLLASVAWNRLVFVIGPTERTPRPFISMLRQPIALGLQRNGSDKDSKSAKQNAISAYCNLLYYALRPGASNEQLDLYWDAYVHKVLGPIISHSKDDADTACQILTPLFSSHTRSIWNENRANEAKALKAEDLPRVDPKWTRLNLPKILKLVRRCLPHVPWDCKNLQRTPFCEMWDALMTSLRDAGNQEIKASVQSKEAVAQITNMLRDLWTSAKVLGGKGLMSDHAFAGYAFITQVAIDRLGPMLFTDKILVRNERECFEAAVTPSHRQGNMKAPLPPATVIFEWLIDSPTASDSILLPTFISSVKTFVKSCSEPKATRARKFDTLADLAQCTSVAAARNAGAPYAPNAWLCVVDLTESALAVSNVASSQLEVQSREYTNVLRVICSGLHFDGPQYRNATEKLTNRLIAVAVAEIGSEGAQVAVVEPLAGLLCAVTDHEGANSVHHLVTLLLEQKNSHEGSENVTGARDISGDRAQKHNSKAANNLLPLYEITNRSLKSSYETQGMSDLAITERLLRSVACFIRSTPVSNCSAMLEKIQSGLVIWGKDEEEKLACKDGNKHVLSEAVSALKSGLCDLFARTPRAAGTSLDVLQTSIMTDFLSKHEVIADETRLRPLSTDSDLEKDDSVSNESAPKELSPYTELRQWHLSRNGQEKFGALTVAYATYFQSTKASSVDSPRSDLGRIPKNSRAQHATRRCLSSPGVMPARTQRSIDTSARSSRFSSPIRGTPVRRSQRPHPRPGNTPTYFSAVESPSTGKRDLFSQLLTDHKNNVTFQQQMGAGLSTENSSAIIFQQSKTLFQPEITSSDLAGPTDISSDRSDAPTPTLHSPTYGFVDDFVRSSPTPQRASESGNSLVTETPLRQISTTDDPTASDAVDPPSSPPVPSTDAIVSQQLHGEIDRGSDDVPFQAVENSRNTSKHGNNSKHVVSPAQLSNSVEFMDARMEQTSSRDEEDPEIFVDASPRPLSCIIGETDRQELPSKLFEDLPRVPQLDFLQSQERRGDISESGPKYKQVPSPRDATAAAVMQREIDLNEDHPERPQAEDEMDPTGDQAPTVNNDPSYVRPDITTPLSRVSEAMFPGQSSNEHKIRTGLARADITVSTPPSSQSSQVVVSTASDYDSGKQMRKRKSGEERGIRGAKRVKMGNRTQMRMSLRSSSILETDDDPGCVAEPTNDPAAVSTIKSQKSRKQAAGPDPATLPKRKRGRPRKTAPSDDTELQATSATRIEGGNDNQPCDGGLRITNQENHDTVPPSEVPESVEGGMVHQPRVSKRLKTSRHAEGPASTSTTRQCVGDSSTSIITGSDDSTCVDSFVSSPINEEDDVGVTARASKKRQRQSTFEAEEGVYEKSREVSVSAESGMSSSIIDNRPKVKPRSILGRLKQLLSDCRQLVLGSQEERELDDALFEVRKEVHEAGRRGRMA